MLECDSCSWLQGGSGQALGTGTQLHVLAHLLGRIHAQVAAAYCQVLAAVVVAGCAAGRLLKWLQLPAGDAQAQAHAQSTEKSIYPDVKQPRNTALFPDLSHAHPTTQGRFMVSTRTSIIALTTLSCM